MNNEPIIFSQPSKTRWYTTNAPLYFDTEVKFSYLSGGKRIHFSKMYESPSLMTVVKWKREDKVERIIFILSTSRFGPKWGYTNNPEDDFYYEDQTSYSVKQHGNYTWYVSYIPIPIDYNIDRNDNYKAISLFSDDVYEDFDAILNDILESADVQPRTVYSGMMGKGGVAFFAGATDLGDIPGTATFIIDCDGKEIKGGNKLC